MSPLTLKASKTRAKVEAQFAWRAVCLGLSRSAERDALLVRRHPLVERLQLGIQRARELDAAVGAVEVVEVGFELEHVPYAYDPSTWKLERWLGLEPDPHDLLIA